jgi:hypothetical protein
MAGLDPMGIRTSGRAENFLLRSRFRFVMPGLDPAIHGVKLPPASTRMLHSQCTRHRVDASVQPGHDKSKMNEENEILPRRPYPDAHGA